MYCFYGIVIVEEAVEEVVLFVYYKAVEEVVKFLSLKSCYDFMRYKKSMCICISPLNMELLYSTQ